MSETKEKRPDYLVLVNEDNRFPDGFEDTVELIPTENVAGNQFKVEKKTYEAFLRLQDDILKMRVFKLYCLALIEALNSRKKYLKEILTNSVWNIPVNMSQSQGVLSIIQVLQSTWEFCWRASFTA